MSAPVRVKICGITCIEDALDAVDAGADALGFIFAPSPRRIEPIDAAEIIRELPPFLTTVGLFVDEAPEPVLRECPLDVIQFHGAESPERVAACPVRSIKAFRVRCSEDLAQIRAYRAASAWLLDAYVPGVAGGTGHRFPWALANEVQGWGGRLIVAGGLTPENVAECIGQTRPYGVDVSTGVERSPGRKDPVKLRDFVQAARSAGALTCPASE